MAMHAIVVMGVSGCGKSSLGRDIAKALGWRMIEGDDFHGPENKALMAAGIPLTDAHRAGWLDALAAELARDAQGVVLSCSALKRSYRERLRAAAPGLGFVYLEISPEEALARVRLRAGEHFFPPGLVASQFEALEPPLAEARVLALDARREPSQLCRAALAWIPSQEGDIEP